jgi:hypothetical protein
MEQAQRLREALATLRDAPALPAPRKTEALAAIPSAASAPSVVRPPLRDCDCARSADSLLDQIARHGLAHDAEANQTDDQLTHDQLL